MKIPFVFILLVLGPFFLGAQLKFQEPSPGDDEWGFRPASGEVCRMTPPPFVWKDQSGAVSYELQYARSGDFKNARTVSGLRWNVYCPPHGMKPGSWFWRVRFAGRGGGKSNWSSVRRFEISSDAVSNPKPEQKELLSRIPAEHPRIFIRPEQLPEFRKLAEVFLVSLYGFLGIIPLKT